jgi:hypothetical protein
MVVHLYNPSNAGSISRKIKVQGQLWAKAKPYLKNN